VQEKLILELDEQLKNEDISGYSLAVKPTKSSDVDPQTLYVNYRSLFSKNDYTEDSVKVEISCRSLREPFEPIPMRSIIAENFPNQTFADEFVTINTVSPKRTFLEKAFLIHEALQRGRTHSQRMTRHLYDLHKLMDTDFAAQALADEKLYQTIVLHRSIMTREKGVDYSTHRPSQINFVPENEVVDLWRKDYETLLETFVYEEDAIKFDALLLRLKELKQRFRSLNFKETFFENLK
jgi:hypothetical protein